MMARTIPTTSGASAGANGANLTDAGVAEQEEAALTWFAERLAASPGVRAAFASVRGSRVDVWSVLFEPDDGSERQLFALQRDVRQQWQDLTFDFALIYRPSNEPLDPDEWTGAGW